MADGSIRVKLTTSFPTFPLLRQTPESAGVWGKYRFFVDTPVEDYDFWVFYESPVDVTRGICAPQNLVFISGEPPAVQPYPRGFLAQFGTVVTCHRTARHPDLRFVQQGLPWHIGSWHMRKDPGPPPISYDQFKTIHPVKTRCLSVISSSKLFTKGHTARLEFVRKLKARLGDRVELFGRGVRDFVDKWEVIAPYKYHIALENSAIPDYWTEKLADPLLVNTFPFYFGCTNIGDYFPAGSYRAIDIHDFERSLEIIESTIASGTFESSQDLLKQGRDLVLDKHNLFALLAELLDSKDPSAAKKPVKLRPRRHFGRAMRRISKTLRSVLPGAMRASWGVR